MLHLQVRASEDPPEELKRLPANSGIKPGDIPTLQALGLSAPALKVRVEPAFLAAPALQVG